MVTINIVNRLAGVINTYGVLERTSSVFLLYGVLKRTPRCYFEFKRWCFVFIRHCFASNRCYSEFFPRWCRFKRSCVTVLFTIQTTYTRRPSRSKTRIIVKNENTRFWSFILEGKGTEDHSTERVQITWNCTSCVTQTTWWSWTIWQILFTNYHVNI